MKHESPPNKSLDASGTSRLVIDNWSVTALKPAASTPPLYRFAMPTKRIKDVPMRFVRYILLLSALAFAFAGVPPSQVSGGEEKLCPVHHVPLKKEKLEIVYG